MLATLNGFSSTGAANAASFGLFDNDTDMALNLGFSGFRRGYDFYKSDWKYLNDPTMRGGLTLSTTGTTTANVITGMLVPAGSTTVYDQILGKNAKRLLDTELRVATADNDLNALKAMGSIPEGYAVNHFLTDNNAWFLCTDVPNGLKHFVRTPLQNSMDGDFDTGNVRYKSRERYSFGWSDALGMYGSPGSN